MDVIQSLHIPEQFSEESVDMAFEIGKAFVDCHLVTEAESYLKLLQTVPTYRPAEVFELLYLCSEREGRHGAGASTISLMRFRRCLESSTGTKDANLQCY